MHYFPLRWLFCIVVFINWKQKWLFILTKILFLTFEFMIFYYLIWATTNFKLFSFVQVYDLTLKITWTRVHGKLFNLFESTIGENMAHFFIVILFLPMLIVCNVCKLRQTYKFFNFYFFEIPILRDYLMKKSKTDCLIM